MSNEIKVNPVNPCNARVNDVVMVNGKKWLINQDSGRNGGGTHFFGYEYLSFNTTVKQIPYTEVECIILFID